MIKANHYPLTLILILISVVVSIISQFGAVVENIRPLFMTDYVIAGSRILFRSDFPEIMDGQIWRLFTPAFVHFGILHLVFNMLWLWDLGRAIEVREGSVWFIILVCTLGVLSNLGQFYHTGPSFGGMSGVVYGLLGYLWMRGRFDPFFGIVLHKEIVVMMIVWFFVCLTGLVGNIGNTAHGVGLVLGMLIGFLLAKRSVMMRQRK